MSIELIQSAADKARNFKTYEQIAVKYSPELLGVHLGA